MKEAIAIVIRKRNQVLWVIVALLILPALVVLSGFYSTHRRMEEFRTRIVPSMRVQELVGFAGQPYKILHQGEPLRAARRSYTIPELDGHTAIYFYPREGIPYFNVYVFVDERQNTVMRSDIENLWW